MLGRRRHRGGSPVIRHQPRERPFASAGAGCSETIEAVDRHVARFIGPVDTVHHEIVSDLVHIDVHVVSPGPGRPWAADPPAPFAEDTAFCAVLLAPPVTLPEDFRTLRTEDGRQVGLLAMVPLLADELDLKLREGTDTLIDHLDRAGVTELLDPGRRSCLPSA